MAQRQAWLMTPYVRQQAAELGISLFHQSSFQGGDGYRLFGGAKLAEATMRSLLAAEMAPQQQDCATDAFYQQTDFSLDLFLALKAWHEQLLIDPNYSDLIDLFGSNLLPPTGSRPTKRVVDAGGGRRGPSKIRAIAHNAILQQLGFLANVISGMGHAATVDVEEFVEVYQRSPRLRQCFELVLTAKRLGSLNTVLSYCRLVDPGFCKPCLSRQASWQSKGVSSSSSSSVARGSVTSSKQSGRFVTIWSTFIGWRTRLVATVSERLVCREVILIFFMQYGSLLSVRVLQSSAERQISEKAIVTVMTTYWRLLCGWISRRPPTLSVWHSARPVKARPMVGLVNGTHT